MFLVRLSWGFSSEAISISVIEERRAGGIEPDHHAFADAEWLFGFDAEGEVLAAEFRPDERI
jgi:hypothetical protein